MKTLYYTTNQFVRREGNVIDFTEYRNRMQRAAVTQPAVGDDVSFHWETDDSVWHYEEKKKPAPQTRPTEPKRQYSLADVLEICAAGGTLALVITVWLQFLF